MIQQINTYFCKNHSSSPSGYFVAQQPWIKYCKACALNVALCGKRIEKSFSPDEIERKIIVETAANEMKANLTLAEKNSQNYQKLALMFKENNKVMVERIDDINKVIKELTASKEHLEKLYAEELQRKAQVYASRQNTFFIVWMEMKRQLEIIESNFQDIISFQQNKQFEKLKSRWKELLAAYGHNLIGQQEFGLIKSIMCQTIQKFYDQYETIIQFTYSSLGNPSLPILSPDQQIDLALTPIATLNQSHAFQEKPCSQMKKKLKLRSCKKSQKSEYYLSNTNSKKELISDDFQEGSIKQNKML